MNIFSMLAGNQFTNPFVLGHPLTDRADIDRRLTSLAQLTGGKGFRMYPSKPVRTVNGKTRAERKAERVERADAATDTYHANLKLAREKGLIGQAKYLSPDHVAAMLVQAADGKIKKSRTRKVTAGVDTASA